MKKGKLIVIEGPDYTGKKTQTGLLYDKLTEEGFPVKRMRFPQYEKPTGRIIGQCYLGKQREGYIGDSAWFGNADDVDPRVASLYYAADRLATKPEMTETLESGINLLTDRYYHSNMAHQGGKIKEGFERQRFFQYVMDLELSEHKIPKEDLLLLLTLPPELAIKRGSSREESADGHENLHHIKNAAETYNQLYSFFQYKNNWRQIDCATISKRGDLKSKDAETIHKEIYGYVKNTLSL